MNTFTAHARSIDRHVPLIRNHDCIDQDKLGEGQVHIIPGINLNEMSFQKDATLVTVTLFITDSMEERSLKAGRIYNPCKNLFQNVSDGPFSHPCDNRVLPFRNTFNRTLP